MNLETLNVEERARQTLDLKNEYDRQQKALRIINQELCRSKDLLSQHMIEMGLDKLNVSDGTKKFIICNKVKAKKRALTKDEKIVLISSTIENIRDKDPAILANFITSELCKTVPTGEKNAIEIKIEK